MHRPGAAGSSFCPALPVPQLQPMDLRVGQRPPVEPAAEPTLLALQRSQHLHHQLFLAGLQHQQVEHIQLSLETAGPEAPGGHQEQELRQLLHKDKSKRSAVASHAVKQKLAEVILKKQQAALERTTHSNIPFRTLGSLETEGAPPTVLNTFLPTVPSLLRDSPEHFPLRKTVSEPNLKLRYKPLPHPRPLQGQIPFSFLEHGLWLAEDSFFWESDWGLGSPVSTYS